MRKVDIRLYGLIDSQIARGRPLAELTLEAVKGGATLIQYRDKNAETREMIEQARAIKAILAGSSVPVLINDRVDVAQASGADGVHVGQQDMHVRDVRAILGPDAIIGLTINNDLHADETPNLPIDYACIGGVFTTHSKQNFQPPIGVGKLSELIEKIHNHRPFLPLGAIAGIDIANAASVIAAGADGIAVISSLFGHDNIITAATDLRTIIDAALKNRGK